MWQDTRTTQKKSVAFLYTNDKEAETAFNKNQKPLHVKGLGEIRDKRNITKPNKSNIQKGNTQHQTEWRETQINYFKIRNKTWLSTLSISIQHSFCSTG